MFTDLQVLEQLKSYGKETARKTFLNHGACENVYGVLTADLQKIYKQIQTNHALAQQLWRSGNHEARLLALMIADPQQTDDALLDLWATDLSDYIVSSALATFAAKTPPAWTKFQVWIQSDDEWLSSAGWYLLGSIAIHDKTRADSDFAPYIPLIERDIHTRKNRTRHAMNGALIAIGGRSAALAEIALPAAARIGKVKVDHGKTSCKTPDAVTYIQKVRARGK